MSPLARLSPSILLEVIENLDGYSLSRLCQADPGLNGVIQTQASLRLCYEKKLAEFNKLRYWLIRLDEDFPANILDITDITINGQSLQYVMPEISILNQLDTLDLEDNLFRNLPLTSLTNLHTLDLGSNQISILPAEIGGLKHLENLDLWDNQISILPAEIGALKYLEYLNLSSNQISILPVEIAGLINLENLALSDNQISILPTEIGELTNLQWFDLSVNQISILPAEIGRLTNLEHLNLFSNQISILPIELGSLISLKILNLRSNQISTFPTMLIEMASLSSLYLHQNPLIVSPDILAQLKKLGVYLDLLPSQSTPSWAAKILEPLTYIQSIICLVVAISFIIGYDLTTRLLTMLFNKN